MSSSDFQYQIVEPEQLSDADWDKLTEMTHAAFKEHAERGLTMLSVSCSASFLKNRCLGNKLILAKASDKTVGYYCFSIMPITNNQTIFKCVTLAIHPNFKRRGLGRELHRLALEQARQYDCAYGILDTSCGAASARAAHKAAGYKDWYYTHFPNANYYSIVMRKDLTSPLSAYARCKALACSWLEIHLKITETGKPRLLYSMYKKLKYIFRQKPNLPAGRSHNLRKLTLRESQQLSYELLKTFADFCEKHNLRYLLSYGTLIGAIRHKGFIPWDDDIDVTMPLPDYYKFRQLFEKENQVPHLDLLYDMKYNVGTSYTMLGDMRTIANMSGRDIGHARPVAIDIMPCYPVSDDDVEARQGIRDMKNLISSSWRYLSAQGSTGFTRFIRRAFINDFMLAFILRKVRSILHKYSWGQTRRARIFAVNTTAFTFLESEDFDCYVLQPFEEGTFRIPKNYDTQLTAMYGDYMKLPPQEQQVPDFTGMYIIQD